MNPICPSKSKNCKLFLFSFPTGYEIVISFLFACPPCDDYFHEIMKTSILHQTSY
jgi:hypothetical protein